MKKIASITEIPDNIILLEQCPAFNLLLRFYSKEIWRIIEPKDFLDDLSLLESFDEFFREKALSWNLSIKVDEKLIPRVSELIFDFKLRYWYIVKWSDKIYVKVRKTLYWCDKKTEEQEQQIKKDMRKFLAAYHMMKSVFENVNREGILPWETKPERYFNHLKWTMKIVLEELPNPNINTVVIALLHDSIEDIEWINLKTLESIFWSFIASWVHKLSKKDLNEYYLSEYERKIFDNLSEELQQIIIDKAKVDRQDDYFWHLPELWDDYLTVKFADRIHNLRTMNSMSKKQIEKKIFETEKYFLPVAITRNKIAYDLMLIEINKLKNLIKL